MTTTQSVTKIAVLGTGKVGSALGTKLASVGHQVVYGSRTPSGEATLPPGRRRMG